VVAGDRAAATVRPNDRGIARVRKTPSWPRSGANCSLLQLYSHRNERVGQLAPSLLGRPNTFLALNACWFSLPGYRAPCCSLAPVYRPITGAELHHQGAGEPLCATALAQSARTPRSAKLSK
jgi:hypothetical protein